MRKAKKTVIEIYPTCPKPRWMRVGCRVEVLGEGMGNVFRVTAIENGRAAVVPEGDYSVGHPGGCWESFTKIYRPGRFEEDLK